MNTYVGLDIGGTKLMVAASDESGRKLARALAPTPHELEDGLAKLDSMITDLTKGAKISAMGAAIGGPLDWERGIVSPLHQPKWKDVPLKALMEDKFRCPVRLDVDTNVAALGEYRLGRYEEERFLYITLSTGMGGGFLLNGAIYRGGGGSHPEVGHQAVPFRSTNSDAVKCECGAPDCLEALVSGNGIRRTYGKPAESLNDAEWEEVAYNLGLGLRNIATILLPDVIVFGGGVALGGGNKLLMEADRVMRERLKITPAPKLLLSRLGYDTALEGALSLARDGW